MSMDVTWDTIKNDQNANFRHFGTCFVLFNIAEKT